MLPSLEAFGAQETNDAGIPSVLGDIGHFQCEGDVSSTPGRLSAGHRRASGMWAVGI